MMPRLMLLAGLLCAPLTALAQTPPAPPTPAPQQTRLRVFLDCFECFPDYLRDEIRFVDFVRQPQDADVHLLASSQGTGGGGRELILRFVGNGRFKGVDHEHRVISLSNEPEELRRRAVLRVVTIGLLDYLSHAGLPTGLDVEVTQPREQPAAPTPTRDPWNLWFFRVSVDASLNAEESNRESRWSVSLSGDRVTEQWRISLGLRANEESEEFDLDEDDPFEVTRREREFDWFVGKSLGPHWSIGAQGAIESSTFGNVEFSAEVAPAVEYSVFPYADYATRQLTLQYRVGVDRARYNEVTLFGKTRETLGRHAVEMRLEQSQPWGSLDASAEFSQYLHDRGLYRVEVDGELSFRVTRGLSVDVEGSASRIRDQISLPARGATPEEILLRLRELQSGYDVRFSVGVSYSFGSIFNNVVNPRFGR
jgi:hypothetical protein